MNLKKKIVFELLLILLLVNIATFPSMALDNISQKTNQYEISDNFSVNSTVLEKTNSLETDLSSQSNRNFDQTLSMLNIVVAGIGVLVALIGVLVALMTLFFVIVAFFGYQSYKDIKSEMASTIAKAKEAADKVEKESKEKIANIEELLNKTKKDCENSEKNVNDLIEKIKIHEIKIKDMINDEIESFYLGCKNPPSKVLEKYKQLEEILQYLEALGIQLKPSDIMNRGLYYYYNKKCKDAVEVFDNVLKIEPDNLKAMLFKGICLVNSNTSQAISLFNKIVETNPNNDDIIYKDALYNLACAYSVMKNKEASLNNLKKAIDLCPGYKEMARQDEDFKELRENTDFKELIE